MDEVNATQILFMSLLAFAFGKGLAFFFRKLNPFMMILGLMSFGFFLALIHASGQTIPTIAGAIGFLTTFIPGMNIFYIMANFFSWVAFKFLPKKQRQQQEYEEEYLHGRDYFNEEDEPQFNSRPFGSADNEYEKGNYDDEDNEDVRKRQEKYARQGWESERDRTQSHSKNRSNSEKKYQDYNEQARIEGSIRQAPPNNGGIDRRSLQEILGLRKGFTQTDLKRAYREQSKRFHPDKHQGKNTLSEAMLEQKKINEAYEILLKRFK